MWCLSVCHPHLTTIVHCTAVWAQARGLKQKKKKVLSLSVIFGSSGILDRILLCWRSGGSSITILPLLVLSIRTIATVASIVQCAQVNTLQYHDTFDLVPDFETEDPQLVAEPGVGPNHGKRMGKS